MYASTNQTYTKHNISMHFKHLYTTSGNSADSLEQTSDSTDSSSPKTEESYFGLEFIMFSPFG